MSERRINSAGVRRNTADAHERIDRLQLWTGIGFLALAVTIAFLAMLVFQLRSAVFW